MQILKNLISPKQAVERYTLTLWDTGAAADSMVANLSSLYRHWFIVIFVVECILYFTTKDQRKKDVELKVLIGSVVVYILTSTEIQSMITSTIDTFIGWF